MRKKKKKALKVFTIHENKLQQKFMHKVDEDEYIKKKKEKNLISP